MKSFSIQTFLVIIIGVSVITLGINYGYSTHYSWQNIWKSMQWILIYSSVMYALYFVFYYVLNQIFEEDKNLLKRTVIGVLGSAVVGGLGIAICNYMIAQWLLHIPFEQTYAKNYFVQLYVYPFLLSFIINLLIYIKNFYKKYYALQNLYQAVELGKISQQYDSLQQQLSPHFLFNSFNVLEALIEEEPNQAQIFVQDLAKVYRYVLQQENQLLVNVSEELEFAKVYIQLMNVRFENAIQLSIDEKINVELKILPLSIQLALENAIKHNVFSEDKPLEIAIKQVGESLVIRNNRSPKLLKNTTQKGLANIQNRLASFGKNATIEKTENEFILTIPLLTQNSIIMENHYQSYKAQQVEIRIKQLKKFYNHLFTFIFVITLLTALNAIQNYYSSHAMWWVIWVIFGWGIGLSSHALRIFVGINSIIGKDWEERKRKELMEKM